jgi:hypothetical protein
MRNPALKLSLRLMVVIYKCPAEAYVFREDRLLMTVGIPANLAFSRS